MESEKWGRRIRAFRKLKGLTQKDLAEKLGVSLSFLGEVERGVREPSIKFLSDIAKVLDIQVEELIPKDDN